LAEFVGSAGGRQGHRLCARHRLQRGYLSQIREIAKKPAAIFAADILKIQEFAAALAAEQFHRGNSHLGQQKRLLFKNVPVLKTCGVTACSRTFALAA
jgi:RecA/RadA recombinase